MLEEAVAIITARGGSKRIPGKNIKDFCGQPIIAYSIQAALASELFAEVMVSTDSEEIAKIGEKYGAATPFFRSAKTSDDFSSTSDVLKEVIGKYEARGRCFRYACCIYPTAPFVTAEKLQTAMRLLNEKDADTVMPVAAYSFPPQRSMLIKDGRLAVLSPEHFVKRSQDLEPIYHDCGQFYLFRVDRFLATGKLIGQNTVPLIVDETEAHDIDNESDWTLAEIKFQIANGILKVHS